MTLDLILYYVCESIHLKAISYIVLLIFTSLSAYSQQFYIRGEVKDESGNLLQNVNILQHSSGNIYYSGSTGSFGFISNKKIDTLTFSNEGYQKEKIVADAGNYIVIKMKLLSVSSNVVRRFRLSSLTKNLTKETQRQWFAGDETYASTIENRFVNARQYPATGMSLNIDRASYSNVRRFLNMNTQVPPDAVRIEEMLNYFNFSYDEPVPGEPFKIRTTLTSCPWKSGNQLFFVNVSSKKINVDTLPASHLVFLIDISGSMDMPNRLPLLKSAFRLLVNNLREKDSVSIVVYGGTVAIMLNPTSGTEKEKILKAIDGLVSGGSTPGESGIRLAYSVAKRHFIKGGNNRVILATDGDFNVGVKTENELDELISLHKESGIYLTCLGVGMGNYKDSKIQTLARRGNGNFSYFDNYQEAEKVLLKEFTQTLYAVADDVYMNVSFNPSYVAEYRLIGFDNKVGAISDTLSVVEGGEIGSGHTVMAVFEIVPTPLNENTIEQNFEAGTFAEVNLQFKYPNGNLRQEYKNKSKLCFIPLNELDECYRFSSAVIMFGSLLRSSQFVKNTSWNDIIAIASASVNKDEISQREFLILVQLAKKIYSKKRKKKKDSDSINY